eukprot:3025407-Rhodomonas_salina.1
MGDAIVSPHRTRNSQEPRRYEGYTNKKAITCPNIKFSRILPSSVLASSTSSSSTRARSRIQIPNTRNSSGVNHFFFYPLAGLGAQKYLPPRVPGTRVPGVVPEYRGKFY